MSTRTKKKGKGNKNKQKKGGKNKEIQQLKTMIEALKKEVDSMNKTIKKQNKRISALETENKRTKKNIQKLILNSTGHGTLIVPQSSNDALASDIDVKDDDYDNTKQTKKHTKYKKKTKPKPVAVVEPPKPKPPKKLKFSFQMNHQKISAVDNASTAVKPKSFSGTIRFGRLLNYNKNNNDKIVSYTIIIDTRSIGQISGLGVGFLTNSFNGWVGSNFGENNSCFVKGNGQFCTSKKIYKCLDNKQYEHKKIINELLNDKKAFFNCGDEVAVEINLKECIGRIWNDTSNKDGTDNDKMFEINLPNDYEVAIAIYLSGAAKKKVFVKDQKFIFED